MSGPEPQPWIRLDGSEIKPGDPDFVGEPLYTPLDIPPATAPLHAIIMAPPTTGMSFATEVHRPHDGGELNRGIQADKDAYAAHVERAMIEDEERQFRAYIAALSRHKEELAKGKRNFERYQSTETAAAAAHPVERVTTNSAVYMGSHSTPAIIDAYVRYTYADTGGRDSSSITIHRSPNAPPAGVVYYRSGPDDSDDDECVINHDNNDELPPLEWDIESVLRTFPDEMVEHPTEISLAAARQMLTNLSKYCVQTGPDTSLLGHVSDIHWTLNGRCWITFKNGLNMFQEHEDPESWFVVEKCCTTKKLGGVRGLADCVLFACFKNDH